MTKLVNREGFVAFPRRDRIKLFSCLVVTFVVTGLMSFTYQLPLLLMNKINSTFFDEQQQPQQPRQPRQQPQQLRHSTTDVKRKTSHQRIAYFLRRNVTYPMNLMDEEPYSCHSSSSRLPLNGTKFSTGVFDFSTWIKTDLSILVVGDSVAMQLAHSLEIAGSNGSYLNRTVFRAYPHAKHNKQVMGTGVSPMNGGGVIAHLRLNALWLPENTEQPLPRSGSGWRIEDTVQLRNYSLSHRKTNHYDSIASIGSEDNNQSRYEVTIFRVSHPWVPLQAITYDNLKATVETAWSVMGSQTIILTTVWKNNNLFRPDQWEEAKAANRVIRQFAKNFTASSSTSIVLVCDMAQLVEVITEANGKELGFNTSDSSFVFHNLQMTGRKSKRLARSIPQVCAERVQDGDAACLENSFFHGGLHLCMMTLGGRINGNFACLIGCAHNKNNQTHHVSDINRDELWKCEQRCNEDFMSVRALPPIMMT